MASILLFFLMTMLPLTAHKGPWTVSATFTVDMSHATTGTISPDGVNGITSQEPWMAIGSVCDSLLRGA